MRLHVPGQQGFLVWLWCTANLLPILDMDMEVATHPVQESSPLVSLKEKHLSSDHNCCVGEMVNPARARTPSKFECS
jgi:hypothetical protein